MGREKQTRTEEPSKQSGSELEQPRPHTEEGHKDEGQRQAERLNEEQDERERESA